MAKVTIDEVAARARVTKSTVSHALSGKRPVAPETRLRIEAAITELGYRPNPVAQRLAAGRSRAMGLIFPPEQTEITAFDTPFVAATTAAAGRAGYALVLILPGATAPSDVGFAGDGLLDGAILLHAGQRDARVTALRVEDVPFVLIGRTADNAGLSFVDVDVDAAVDLCVERLAALGHRRIAFLRDSRPGEAMAARALQAYELACARRRIRLLVAACNTSVGHARVATARLLGEHGDITGIIAWNEWAGWAATEAARDAGLRVPEDLSVVCLTHGIAVNLLPFDPTCVDLRSEALAGTAVTLLLELLDGEGAGEQQALLQPELIAGSTTGPARL